MKASQLLHCCRQDFTSGDISRGWDYFNRGAVTIRASHGERLVASVRGSARTPYTVQLDWGYLGDQTLLVDCTCPRCAETGACKHIAATIIAADAKGRAPTVRGRPRLYLEPLDDLDPTDEDDETLDDDWEGDSELVDADEFADAYPGSPRAMSPLAQLRRGPAQFDGDHWVLAGGRAQAPWESNNSATRGPVNWKSQLARLAQDQDYAGRLARQQSARQCHVYYILDLPQTYSRGLPFVELYQRKVKKNGQLGKFTGARFSQQEIEELVSADDRVLLGLLGGNDPHFGFGMSDPWAFSSIQGAAIRPGMFEAILPRLGASGRFGRLGRDETGQEQFHPLAWDDGPPWQLRCDVTKDADGKNWLVQGVLARGAETRALHEPLMVLSADLVIFPEGLARFDSGEDFRWTSLLRECPTLKVPHKQLEAFVEQVSRFAWSPPIQWPQELDWTEERVPPQPILRIARSDAAPRTALAGELHFAYGDHVTPFGDGPAMWCCAASRRIVRRDLAKEAEARDLLLAAGVRQTEWGDFEEHTGFFVPADSLPQLAATLLAAGWQIEAEGRKLRAPGRINISVTSGVDWFDLAGTCDFGGAEASLPALLAAHERGEAFVQLGDGSSGLLPSEWLARYSGLAQLGNSEKDSLRFAPAQAMLLDALLSAQDDGGVAVDAAFARLRDRLKSFDGVQPRSAPPAFTGELRSYQCDGLGWLHFLDELGFGGCLADDMGLGKTIQVLAYLAGRRSGAAAGRSRNARKSPSQPSLIVVPRSLVFNWIEEAGRFAPELKVLNCTGLERRAFHNRLSEYDVVLTTYGTLRRDIAQLGDVEFDCAILDEAQAIKNPASQSAKACRLIRARRRLALTGTPVENHLGDLWSIFEFLNPGMLGRSSAFSAMFAKRDQRRGPEPDADGAAQRGAALGLLAKALRPFILRRTKRQVLTDLPPKSEQTLYCELSRAENKGYQELRDHYRRALAERIEKQGVNRSKIHVLEALLRLRQAACHPGLLDRKRVDDSSAKLEALLEQLAEVTDEGHKALVFSQFTSFLAIVRRELDRRGVVYEYLDGKTVQRQDRVQRFQTDEACRLFLISLKAGGQGLNLTAADYVFILDPWWNPAVEAQAVDRAYRIGQDRHVFAYRLIARGTVEEKILQLQSEKRELADAIVSEDNSVLRNLTLEDVQLLLS